MKLNLPQIDTDKSEEGSWIDYSSGISFCIARDGNKGYTADMQKMYKQNRRFIENKSMTDEQADSLLSDLQAKHILKGWKGLKNGTKDFPYSLENAKLLLSDSSYQEVRDWIMEQAAEAENYRTDSLK